MNLNSNYTQDKKEHHCILYDDSSGKKISVVGTYGNFGYFEGKDKLKKIATFEVNIPGRVHSLV